MPVAERLLVDTNILLEATDEKRPYHHEARELIESQRGLVHKIKTIVSLNTDDFALFGAPRITAITPHEARERLRP